MNVSLTEIFYENCWEKIIFIVIFITRFIPQKLTSGETRFTSYLRRDLTRLLGTSAKLGKTQFYHEKNY